VRDFKTEISELKTSVEVMSTVFDELKMKCESNEKSIAELSSKISDLERKNSEPCDCEIKLKSLQESVSDLRCRSMKSNLIFNGLKEVRNEDTEDMIRQFLEDELGIGERVEISAVHRFGKKKDGIRPIVIRFLYMKDLEFILKHAYRLRNNRFSIRQQFPPEIEENRRKLYPVMREAKREKKQVTLVRDRLYIDNLLLRLRRKRVLISASVPIQHLIVNSNYVAICIASVTTRRA
jgi:hypothetical protein